MFTLSPMQLQEALTRFDGRRIREKNLNEYHKFTLSLFSNPRLFSNARIECTSQLDITDLYKNYELYYKNTPDATFVVFLKWILIKTMFGTPFNWRYINQQWYEFDNLPLCVGIRTSDMRSQIHPFLYDVTDNSWPIL
jgi:chloramphenicol O-acetyltransferase